MHEYQFSSDLKIIPLSSYDIILGMDWLEAYSPMKVHWGHKWMAIPYQGSAVLLYGSWPEAPGGTMVQVCLLELSTLDEVPVDLPQAIQQLIEEFATLFEAPKELPPSRAYDHVIPLVEGAAPVQVRPYRYAPTMKDEIEAKINEILQNGII